MFIDLADAFIKSDLHCIEGYTLYQFMHSLGFVVLVLTQCKKKLRLLEYVLQENVSVLLLQNDLLCYLPFVIVTSNVKRKKKSL